MSKQGGSLEYEYQSDFESAKHGEIGYILEDRIRRHHEFSGSYFIDMCNDILTNGTSTEGEKVRPHWPDGTPAYTIKKFGVVNRYDLSKEFPILTLRRTALKSATDEMLWIWQRKSNNIHD